MEAWRREVWHATGGSAGSAGLRWGHEEPDGNGWIAASAELRTEDIGSLGTTLHKVPPGVEGGRNLWDAGMCAGMAMDREVEGGTKETHRSEGGGEGEADGEMVL